MHEKHEHKFFFTKDDLEILDSDILAGRYKRVLKARLKNNNKIVAIKFHRPYTAGEFSTRVSSADREFSQKKEKDDFTKLNKLIPMHVPKYFGEFKGKKITATVVEFLDGSMIQDKKGITLLKPKPEDVLAFCKSIETLLENGIIINIDSLMPHNLLYGSNTEGRVSIYMVEPEIQDYSSLDEKKIEGNKQIDLIYARGALSLLKRLYVKQ